MKRSRMIRGKGKKGRQKEIAGTTWLVYRKQICATVVVANVGLVGTLGR